MYRVCDGRVLLGLDRLGLRPVSQCHVERGDRDGVWLICCEPEADASARSRGCSFRCILMLLYIVKGFGVLVWLVRGGDGLDPEGGATFEFGQVAGAAFDLADAAGGDAEGVADLLLGDAVCDAQFTESSSAFGGRFADGRCSCADGDEGPVGLASDEAFQGLCPKSCAKAVRPVAGRTTSVG